MPTDVSEASSTLHFDLEDAAGLMERVSLNVEVENIEPANKALAAGTSEAAALAPGGEAAENAAPGLGRGKRTARPTAVSLGAEAKRLRQAASEPAAAAGSARASGVPKEVAAAVKRLVGDVVKAADQAEKLAAKAAKKLAKEIEKEQAKAGRRQQKAADGAAAAEQRALKEAAAAERKRVAQAAKAAAEAEKAAAAAAKEAEVQARRTPRCAATALASAESTIAMLREAADHLLAVDAGMTERRKALLQPLLEGSAACADGGALPQWLVEFGETVRSALLRSYAEAADLPAASWSEANLKFRAGFVAPTQRKVLSCAFLALPRSIPLPPVAKAHLQLLWEQVLLAFARANAPPLTEGGQRLVVEVAKNQQVRD